MRRPVADAVTSCSSSSVCRLPFISNSASPARIAATARAAAAWLCGASISTLSPRSSAFASATWRMRASGPISSGTIRPRLAACSAPPSEEASQGCATAVGMAGKSWQRASRTEYLSSVWVIGVPVRRGCGATARACCVAQKAKASIGDVSCGTMTSADTLRQVIPLRIRPCGGLSSTVQADRFCCAAGQHFRAIAWKRLPSAPHRRT